MYIGNDLQIAHPSYKIIDDISSGFNGSTTSFALQVSGATPVPFPISTQQVMISVNGVVQEPDPTGSAGFKLLGSNIVFSSAPANGHAFFGVINAGADYVTAGSEFPDGSVTAPSFTFQDDQDTGWYRNASGDVGYSSNGAAILNFDGNGLTIAAGKGLTVDTSTLKVDAANNRVGIGTTSPSNALDVQAGTTNTAIVARSTDTKAQISLVDNSTTSVGSVVVGAEGDNLFFASGSGGSEAARFDSSGRLLLGFNASQLIYGSQAAFQVSGTGFATSTISIRRDQDNHLAGGIVFAKSRGSQGGVTVVQSGDSLGSLIFAGADGTDLTSTGAEIEVEVDGTPGSNDIPGRILFKTTADGSAGPTERMRIDSSGRLLVGVTASRAVNQAQGSFQIEGTGAEDSDMSIIRNQASSGGPALCFGKSRNASLGGNTVVNDDDQLGAIIFNGNDGTDLASQGARIDAYVDGTPGSNDMPGRLVFSTTADGASTSTERMRIGANGTVTLNSGNGHTHSTLILSKADAGAAKLEFDVGTSQKAYVELDSAEDLIHYGASGVSQVFYTGGSTALTINASQNATFAGTVSDSKGNLRSIPQNHQTSAYVLVASDAGKCIKITSGGVTVNTSVFSAGDAVTIVNHSGSDQTITQGSSFTLHNTADATTGNRTLAGRGMATIWFENYDQAYISGAGLS